MHLAHGRWKALGCVFNFAGSRPTILLNNLADTNHHLEPPLKLQCPLSPAPSVSVCMAVCVLCVHACMYRESQGLSNNSEIQPDGVQQIGDPHSRPKDEKGTAQHSLTLRLARPQNEWQWPRRRWGVTSLHFFLLVMKATSVKSLRKQIRDGGTK